MPLIKLIIQYGFTLSLLFNALLFVPQIISIIRCKTAKGVSLITFAGFNIIQGFTLLHGIQQHDYLLAWGYLLSMITCGSVTLLIIFYKFSNPEQS